MSQLELLIKVVNVLDSNHIDYMLTGSIVSSLQGEPRSTHDIDIVVSIKNENIDVLLESFKQPDYYLDKESIENAILNMDMFNLIEINSGDKVDFWLFTNNDFDKSRYSRKYKEKIFDNFIYVSTPEDTIIAKLKWSKLSGGSRKHFIDALRIYEVQNDILDINYIEKWVTVLEVSDLWKNIYFKKD